MTRRNHRWVNVRVHVYICRECGTGRVNSQQSNGNWITAFHRPDGTSIVDSHVPPCESGPKTTAYLKCYESAIACAEGTAG